MPPWANGKAAKEYRAAMGSKPVGGIFSVGVEEAYRWKDSVQSEAEIRIWFADGVANGLRPWFTKFSGVLRDRRWLGVVEDLYRWHHGAERYLRNEAPLARVGLVYSQQTAWFYGGPRARAKVEDHALGWYQALIEARIPFEMVHDRLLDADAPGAAPDAHPAEHRRPLRRAVPAAPRVRRAGRRARGDLRDLALRRAGRAGATDFGLADLFGVSFRRQAEGPMRNAYLRLEADPRTGSGTRCSTASTTRPGSSTAPAGSRSTPRSSSPHPPLTLIPSYPDLPMEMVYPRVPQTEVAEVVPARGRAGTGRLLPLGHRPRLLGGPGRRSRHSCSATPCGGRPTRSRRCEVEGPGVLDVTVWRQAALDDRAPGQPDEPDDDEGPVPRADPRRRAAGRRSGCPQGRRPGGSSSWWRGARCPVAQDGTRLSVTVPSVRDLEVVAIDL